MRLVGIRFLIQGHADLVDHLVAPFFLDIRAHQPGLVPVDIVLGQNLLDRFNPGLNRGLVVGGAVLAEQVLQHV